MRIRAALPGFGPVATALLFACLVFGGTAARAEDGEPIRLQIVGSLAGISQYTDHEEPFWSREIAAMSHGRVVATINPFDRSGLRAQEMLHLMRLGVVPFGTALLTLVAGDEPELSAVDLPGLNPDIAALRKSIRLYRPHIEKLLRDRYDIELLGVYTYPAQVVFCAKPFRSLADLAGRRVRTSSVSQSEMMVALGAEPVVIPFAKTVDAISQGKVDCAVTGTLSGHEVGLTSVTTHIHAMALNWGLSMFGANRTTWEALPEDVRTVIVQGVRTLEQRIWDAADTNTALGVACATGDPACTLPAKGNMTLVRVTPADEELRARLLTNAVLPAWVDRCGAPCVRAWNERLAGETGIELKIGDAG